MVELTAFAGQYARAMMQSTGLMGVHLRDVRDRKVIAGSRGLEKGHIA